MVSPNPPVGAVLVYEDKVLGEGFHTRFGGPHAEVEAFRDVPESLRYLIPKATLYVSLEPCCVTGKTPPCTDLILREGVKDVRVGTMDPNPLMAGNGIELLKSNSVNVIAGILDEDAQYLIRQFRINILESRPYVVLKWAQSIHGFIGKDEEKIWLSHPDTNTWIHQQRSIADAILVGARTVVLDDPLLTTRNFPGPSPHRVIYDPNARLSEKYRAFNNDGCKVFYFSALENKNISAPHVIKFQLTDAITHHQQILTNLFANRIGILLVEGGAYVHQLFIEHQSWDEARVIRTKNDLDHGIKAPQVKGKLFEKISSASDTILCIRNEETKF